MKDDIITGLVADITRCSIHDGPGIRTAVFLKGCNMRCAWCHNPETVAPYPEWILHPEKCIHCGMCHSGCYSGARVLCGRDYTVDQIMKEILLDKPYYSKDGGLTISGGEPLVQPVFTHAVLKAAQDYGIGTAIESNLSVPWRIAKEVVDVCDILMVDLKLWDEEKHRRWTGQSNSVTKKNLEALAKTGKPLILRTPVIPGVNDMPEEIGEIAAFAKRLSNLLYYELLPYHSMSYAKGSIENGFRPTRFQEINAGEVNELARAAKSCGMVVKVAGRVV